MQIPWLLTAIWAGAIVFPFWKINTKAGYPGWLALLIIIPMVNVAYLYFLAFSPWPNLEEFDARGRQRAGRGRTWLLD